MPLRLYRRKSSPNWYIRGTVRGIVVDESAKTDDREIADAIRIQREAEVLKHSVFGKRATVTWLEAAVDYMERGGEYRFLGRINEYFGPKKLLSDIDQEAIDKAARALYPNAKNSTRNRQALTPISAVLKHAAKRRWIDRFEVERFREEEVDFRYFSPAEFGKLLDECAPHLAPLVIFLVYTGARLSEALYLDWENVDLDRAQVVFRMTKNGKSRAVPLHKRVVATLRLLPRTFPRVFLTDRGVPYVEKRDRRGRLAQGGQIKKAFGRAVERSGIKHASPHDCRHTFASWHYARNRDLLALKMLGGWQSLAMVERYAHVNADDLLAQIEMLPWENSGNGETESQEMERKSIA